VSGKVKFPDWRWEILIGKGLNSERLQGDWTSRLFHTLHKCQQIGAPVCNRLWTLREQKPVANRRSVSGKVKFPDWRWEILLGKGLNSERLQGDWTSRLFHTLHKCQKTGAPVCNRLWTLREQKPVANRRSVSGKVKFSG